jgi:hypothetical protein
MKQSMIRANLKVAGAVELTDPAGNWWTVYVIRCGDPHDRSNNMSVYPLAINRLRRLLTRDRIWDVELLKGTDRIDLRAATLMAREPSRTDALLEAQAIAIAIGNGQFFPSGVS